MPAAKSYLHDRVLLLLLSVNAFLAFFATLSVLFRLQGVGSSGYIVQCRDCANPEALTKFTRGTTLDMLAFVAFALFIFVAHWTLSVRAFSIRRQLSVVILGLGTLLLVLDIIVSNALLVLR
jgi:hypothetical protein